MSNELAFSPDDRFVVAIGSRTVAGLPFGTPRRDDNRTTSDSNPAIKAEFNHLRRGTVVGELAATDTLVAGAKSLIAEAVKSAALTFGLDGATTIIALV
jgi:hypothetical protein